MKNKLNFDLIGIDGNAYALIGYARKQAKKLGWSDEEVKDLIKEATNDDYSHLLNTLQEA